jgi:hypothetical protein
MSLFGHFTEGHYAECCRAEGHHTPRRNTECHYADFLMLSVVLSVNIQCVILLSVIMLTIATLTVIIFNFTNGHNVECCDYEHRNAVILIIILLSVIMRCVIILSVIMLSDAECPHADNHYN